MIKNLLRTGVLVFAFLLTTLSSKAQSGMEEYFYESGKIRVVVTVAAVVLIGIFTYVWMLDRRIRKIERKK